MAFRKRQAKNDNKSETKKAAKKDKSDRNQLQKGSGKVKKR